MADSGERTPITDGDDVDASEDATSSLIIVDAVTHSILSSLVASHVMGGAIGSSESRGKSISPTTCNCRSTGSEYCPHSSFSWYEAKWDNSRAYTAKECSIVPGFAYSCDKKIVGDIDEIGCIWWYSLYNS